MNSVWIVYQSDWSGIEVYFDELKAYKAAVASHAEVIQVGEGDIKEQVKNPRKFNNQPKENTNAPSQESNGRNDSRSRGKDQRQKPVQGPSNQEPKGQQSQGNQAKEYVQTPSNNPLEDRPADLAAAFNDIDFSASQRPNPKPGS